MPSKPLHTALSALLLSAMTAACGGEGTPHSGPPAQWRHYGGTLGGLKYSPLEEITPEKLEQIEKGEALLHELGFRECRVRHHGKLARIEVPADQIETVCASAMRARIDAAFREYGYQYIAVDLRGFRSGAMNEVIAFGQRQPTL